MDRMNGKINKFDDKIRQKEEALNNFNETVMQKQAAATSSNINSLYGNSNRNRNSNSFNANNTNNEFAPSQSNFQTDKNWNHKAAVNQLYNKRDQNSHTLYQ